MILQNWWYTTLLNAKTDFCPPLRADLKTEFLIVGGGMAGLHAALQLITSGHSVALLERNICGGSSTGKSAGFVTPDSELELSQLVRRFGPAGARRVWNLAANGVNNIVRAIDSYGLKCDVQKQDSLFLGIDKKGHQDVEHELTARQTLNFDSTYYDNKELKKVNSGLGYTGGVLYTGTYGINPLLYSQALKHQLTELGVKVYEGTEVTEIKGHTAHTHLGSVSAEKIIVCLDKIKKGFNLFSAHVYNAQTFMSVSEPLAERDMHAIFPAANLMCWDSTLVYSYYRFTGDHRLLLGGGWAATTFLPMDVTEPWVIRSVIKDFKKRFPALRHIEFIQYWPGRIDTTKDLLPIIDTDPTNASVTYVIGCVGLPWAAFAGEYAARRCLGEPGDEQINNLLRSNRKFLIPPFMQKFMGKMISFAINNAYSKYVQKGY